MSYRSQLVVFGLTALVIGALVRPAPAADPETTSKYEYKTVSFGGDEKENVKTLAALDADGWEYVGPITPTAVAFKRPRYGLVYGLEQTGGYLTGVAFSPDGKRVLFVVGADARGKVHLVDAATGRLLRVLDHPYPRSVAFTPDGKKAVSVGYNGDRTVRVWDLDSGKEVDRFAGGFQAGLGNVVVSSDGNSVLFNGSEDKTARLLELGTGRELRRFEGHTATVQGCALSPDGKRSLTGSYDKTVRLWDNETGKEVVRLEGHDNAVWCVAFLEGGKRAASGGWGRDVIVWDLEAGKEVRRLEGSASHVHALAVSRDGGRLACAGYDGDGGIRVFDAKTFKEVCRLDGHKGATYDVAFSPDGRFLASSGTDGTVRLWRLPRD